MSAPKTVRIRTNNRVKSMCTSVCAAESFQLLNAGAKAVWRGKGDSWTAARDRAAEEAGLKPSQAERLEKNWRTMKFPNGDVYRLLLIKYGHLLPRPYDRLCSFIENAADAIDRRAQEIEENNAAFQSHRTPAELHQEVVAGAEREMK